MSVYEEFKELFNPELRRRKRAALLAAEEAERRKAQESLEAEVGALAAHPIIQQYREVIHGKSVNVFPVDPMDAAGAYWFRRGLERAVEVLDEMLATAEENA